MNIRAIVVALAVPALLLTGCKKQEGATEGTEAASVKAAAEVAKDPEKAAKKVATAMASGDLASAATAKSGGGKLDCNTAVPQELRQKYMKDTTMAGGAFINRTLMCSAKKDGSIAYHVTYDCRRTTTLESFDEKKAEEIKESSEQKAIAGLGRSAYGSEQSVYFYDDDADCLVTAAVYRDGEKVLDLAQELSHVLEPGMLPPIEKGKYALDCKKLLPIETLKKFVPGGKLKADTVAPNQMECKLALPDYKTTSVNYTCGTRFDEKRISQMKTAFANRKMPVEDVAVGTAGFYKEMFGSHSITFADGETGCMVSVMKMGGQKAEAVDFAKAVEKALTEDSAK